jgi:hypothetical protein
LLDSQITLKSIIGESKKWTVICPYFKEEFAIESDDKLILDGLAHTAMRPSKNVHDFFGHLNKINSIILDACKGHTILPQEPAPDGNNKVDLQK